MRSVWFGASGRAGGGGTTSRTASAGTRCRASRSRATSRRCSRPSPAWPAISRSARRVSAAPPSSSRSCPSEGRDRLTKLLKDIPPLRFGAGHECTFPAALALATNTEDDWLMGAPGAAFTTTIDLAGFDPLAATPRDAATLALAARAANVKLDDVPPPYDEDLRALVGSRIREAIDEKLPPLIRGAIGPPEYGLIVGYTDDDRYLVRTFFDKDEKPSRIGWPDFIDPEHGGPIFPPPPPPTTPRPPPTTRPHAAPP